MKTTKTMNNQIRLKRKNNGDIPFPELNLYYTVFITKRITATKADMKTNGTE